jgi:hypothetical protein
MTLFDVTIPVTTAANGTASVLSAPVNGYVTTVSVLMGDLDSGGVMDLFVTNDETSEDILTLADMTGNASLHPRSAVQDALGVDIAGQFVPYYVDGRVRVDVANGGSKRTGSVVLSIDGSGEALVDAFADRSITNPAPMTYIDNSLPPYLSDGGGAATGNQVASWPEQEPIFEARDARIVVASQPEAVNASTAMAPVVVHILDAGGQVNPVSQAVVASVKQVGPTLSGTKTRTTDEGVVTFTGLSLNQSGIYTLVFTTAGLAAADSADIVVSPKSVVVAAVGDTAIDTPIAVGVTLKNGGGTTYTGDGTSDITVALTEAGGAVLGGTLTKKPTAGVASFDDLTIDTVGTYTFTVTCGSTTAVSNEFTLVFS